MSSSAAASGRQENVRLDPVKCKDGSRPNVLLAEDSPAARVLTGALLNHIGCDVDVAEHGEEALTYIRNYDYDLVLMDIEMPVMDGVVAAKEIRTMGGTAAATPIVALSAFLADTKRSSFWQQHFDIALSKPAGKHQLHATISQVLDYCPGQSKWLNASNDVEELSSEKSVEIVEEYKLAKIFDNIALANQIALLRTASNRMSLYSGDLAFKQDCAIDEDIIRILEKLRGLSATFAASRLYHLTSGLRDDIQDKAGVGFNRRVGDVCDCANQTAKILRQKYQTLSEGEI